MDGIVLFRRFDPGELPRIGELQVDLRVVGIASGVVVVAALASGLVPALLLSRRSGTVDVGRSATSDRGAARVVGDGPSENVPDYVRWQLVDAGFFPTLSVRAVEGRLLTAEEVAGGATRVVVNRTFARTAWGTRSAVGRWLRIIRTDDDDPWLEVVGVVDDFRQGRLDRDVAPEIYVPLDQSPVVFAGMDFLVRSGLPLESLAPALRAAVWRLDDDQPVGWTDSLDGRIRSSLARHRFYGALLAVFAASAILLVVAGIYGTVAAGIGHRRRELGVRMALGATEGRITGEVAQRSLAWMAVGLLVGTAGSVATGRLVRTLLYGVGAHDGPTFVLAAVTLAVIGGVAVLIPALRVTRIDPAEALRA